MLKVYAQHISEENIYYWFGKAAFKCLHLAAIKKKHKKPLSPEQIEILKYIAQNMPKLLKLPDLGNKTGMGTINSYNLHDRQF